MATLVDVEDDFFAFPEDGFDLTSELLVLDEAVRVVVDFPESDVLDDVFDATAAGFDVWRTWPTLIIYGALMPFRAANSRKSRPNRKAMA